MCQIRSNSSLFPTFLELRLPAIARHGRSNPLLATPPFYCHITLDPSLRTCCKCCSQLPEATKIFSKSSKFDQISPLLTRSTPPRPRSPVLLHHPPRYSTLPLSHWFESSTVGRDGCARVPDWDTHSGSRIGGGTIAPKRRRLIHFWEISQAVTI